MFFHSEPFLPSVMFKGRTKSVGYVGKGLALQMFHEAKKSQHDNALAYFFTQSMKKKNVL